MLNLALGFFAGVGVVLGLIAIVLYAVIKTDTRDQREWDGNPFLYKPLSPNQPNEDKYER